MPTFGERLNEYIVDMGLSLEDIAALLQERHPGKFSYKTLNAYVNGTRTPTYAGLLQTADTIGTSLDWQTGRSTHPKWNPEINEMRLWLRSQVAGLVDMNLLERMVAVIRIMQTRVPHTRQDWFMAGILGVTQDVYRELLTGKGDVNRRIMRRFCDFTGLPSQWVMLGHRELLNSPIDQLGEWAGLVERYIQWGLRVEEAQQHAEWFYDTIMQSRNMR